MVFSLSKMKISPVSFKNKMYTALKRLVIIILRTKTKKRCYTTYCYYPLVPSVQSEIITQVLYEKIEPTYSETFKTLIRHRVR